MMRLTLFCALLAVAALAASWLSWPLHPSDSPSCEIARSAGVEAEPNIERCEQVLVRTKTPVPSEVFIHRQVTLINDGLPAQRFAQLSAQFAIQTDKRYAQYERAVLRQAVLLFGILALPLLVIPALRRSAASQYGNRR